MPRAQRMTKAQRMLKNQSALKVQSAPTVPCMFGCILVCSLLMLVVSAAFLLRHGVGFRWGIYIALALLMLVAAISDLTKRIIPNVCIVLILALWVLFSVLCALGMLGGEESWLAVVVDGVVGACVVGGGTLGLSVALEAITKQVALGGGDIKLLFATSLFLGLHGALFSLLLACVFALIMAFIPPLTKFEGEASAFEREPSVETPAGTASASRFRRSAVPFGPAIALAVVLVLLV